MGLTHPTDQRARVPIKTQTQCYPTPSNKNEMLTKDSAPPTSHPNSNSRLITPVLRIQPPVHVPIPQIHKSISIPHPYPHPHSPPVPLQPPPSSSSSPALALPLPHHIHINPPPNLHPHAPKTPPQNPPSPSAGCRPAPPLCARCPKARFRFRRGGVRGTIAVEGVWG